MGLNIPEAEINSVVSRAVKEVTPLPSCNVETVSLEGRMVAVLSIESGTRAPYVHSDGRSYVRKGHAIVPATASDFSTIFKARTERENRWEDLTTPGVELEDIGPHKVQALFRTNALLKSERPEDNFASQLQTLGLLSSAGINNAAVILFGRDPIRYLPQARIVVTDYSRKSGRSFVLRSFSANSMDLIEVVLKHVFSRTCSLYPELRMDRFYNLLREAIVNAVAHRDYSAVFEKTKVQIYRDKLVVWNPGFLPKTPEQFDPGRIHFSQSPNPKISHVLRLTGLMEQAGIGTRRMVLDSKDIGLESPSWIESDHGVTVEIPLIRQTKLRN